jgi:hypothetical protein
VGLASIIGTYSGIERYKWMTSRFANDTKADGYLTPCVAVGKTSFFA